MIYRYSIKPISPITTPIMSDTLFGHFCWALRYEKGEKYLTDFLDLYSEGNMAPVLFSSAILSGMLPRPVFPPLNVELTYKFVKEKFVDNKIALLENKTDKQKFFIGMNYIKAWSKVRVLTTKQWLILKDDYSELGVLNVFFNHFMADDKLHEMKPFEVDISTSNTVNRVSGTVSAESGGLYKREKIWYHEGTELDIYVEVNDEKYYPFVNKFLTSYLPQTGFGADKSVGMGAIDITFDEKFEVKWLSAERPNARLSLSLTSFKGMEDYNVFYQLKTKFGKLGGDFATMSPSGGNVKPFKKPILMFEPGAVFLSHENLNNKALLENVHSDIRIKHCGIPVTLPFKISEDISYANIIA
jgi:CRISPR-associated protein Csm4